MKRREAAAALLAAGAGSLLNGCGDARSEPAHKPFFQRGMNFTAEHGAMYGSAEANQVLKQLRDRGVDSIALVPYGFERRNEPRVGFGRGWETDDSIRAAAKAAREMGMRILLKPQIWVGRGWPGDIDFPNDPERAEWFGSYATFLEHYAALASEIGAAILSIGVEFGRMTRHPDSWRTLIRLARKHYAGALVYSATQGEEFESISFWDALDYIGLNEYYPLPDDLGTTELVRRVQVVQSKFDKPVIFTEAGFTSYSAPHKAPWDETARQISLEDQANCYEAILRAFWEKPWFYGVYWWRVGTNGEGGPSDGRHTPWGKPAMDVVKRWYGYHRTGN